MTFTEMLLRLGGLAHARGIEGVAWKWDLVGWSPEAPNADARWKAIAWNDRVTVATGEGHTGQEALAELLRKLEST